MTWHTSMTTPEGLLDLVAEIRARGGTVASLVRSARGLEVTWFVLDGAATTAPEVVTADAV